MKSEDGQVYSVCILQFFVLLSAIVCSQNINKQNVTIADETLIDYSFLSRYHYTKSKNYLKRRYRIRHWIPMFIGTPCRWVMYNCAVYFIGNFTVQYILQRLNKGTLPIYHVLLWVSDPDKNWIKKMNNVILRIFF